MRFLCFNSYGITSSFFIQPYLNGFLCNCALTIVTVIIWQTDFSLLCRCFQQLAFQSVVHIRHKNYRNGIDEPKLRVIIRTIHTIHVFSRLAGVFAFIKEKLSNMGCFSLMVSILLSTESSNHKTDCKVFLFRCNTRFILLKASIGKIMDFISLELLYPPPNRDENVNHLQEVILVCDTLILR